MDRTLETLKAAKSLIADPAKWCRFTLAKDDNGDPCDDDDPYAAAWCALGATGKAACDRIESGYAIDPSLHACNAADEELENAAQRMGYESVANCNDQGKGHAEVMSMFDSAIRACKRKNAKRKKAKKGSKRK